VSGPRPITLTVAALGGQGGGVVSDWLVAAGRSAGYLVQATSVPGLAQRTGATIYYLELFAKKDLPSSGVEPIMALMPSPGDVDIVLATELMEAGRAINRGIVTADRTVLITSTHRDYTVAEKSAPSDGRVDTAALLDLARKHARRAAFLDMQKIASENGCRISAVALGALAGSGALPFPMASLRAAIEASDMAVTANLAGFDAAVSAIQDSSPPPQRAVQDPVTVASEQLPKDLRSRVDALPQAIRSLAALGAARLVDYQDERYAGEYLTAVEAVARLDKLSDRNWQVSQSVARGLALWMSFEDVIRVADLKTRSTRFGSIRAEVGARSRDVVNVSEFVKPRVEEICATLPASLGRWVLSSPARRDFLERFMRGRRIHSTHVGGFILLRSLAAMRRLRRITLRYATESSRIDTWLEHVKRLIAHDYDLALQLADCQRLVKGYGDTHQHGWASFAKVTAEIVQLEGQAGAAERARQLREVALATEAGAAA
jgi:indolepyruvate ferredoxin oxidoreductase, beta subunit